MKNKEINNEGDKLFRSILNETKIEASENLSHRVMQQILTEKALSRKKATNYTPSLKNICVIFGVMYLVLIFILGSAYLSYGKAFLENTSLVLTCMSITSIFCMLALIIAFDERRRSKHRK